MPLMPLSVSWFDDGHFQNCLQSIRSQLPQVAAIWQPPQKDRNHMSWPCEVQQSAGKKPGHGAFIAHQSRHPGSSAGDSGSAWSKWTPPRRSLWSCQKNPVNSMDWFKGNFTGTPYMSWENPWFSLFFPLRLTPIHWITNTRGIG